jgi:hypothetical protein
MKVWVVMTYWYDSWDVDKVFPTKESADEYVKSQRDGEWCFSAYERDVELVATSAHGTDPSDSEPQASSTGEDGRSQEEAADGGKAVMEEAND